MSGIIRVTPAELRDMSGRYTNESGQVQELVSRLDTMKNQLQDMWEGASSEAFAAQYEELKPSFVEMSNLLTKIAKQLDDSANVLEDTDNQIASQIRG
ncbi:MULTISPECIES: WXG100 family type VII secretion target [Priestia]|uniref:ESAT-6-like protein n=3 Tax=Priestia TaxID=2800373 RepID=A0AAX6BDR5_PRIMG|nr:MULTISPECIES: WXG100 family type VII secretion target [Priestia]MBK0295034.1 WXG100 family type VII secretion target [Bacillus sp. S34]MCL6710238.1 WXG100 family type VII secretion target [Pseudomonas sp. R2.Fl]MCL9637957.1 WXG100 family type VII secretion target [Bacillus zanthoxyli]NHH93368.1 ESAT-6-like protein [Bacillus sp. MB95]UPK49746.1 WXG100 family type VII secretion target [Bacillus sp. H8-1]